MSFTYTFLTILTLVLLPQNLELSALLATCLFLFAYHWEVSNVSLNSSRKFIAPLKNVYIALSAYTVSFLYIIIEFDILDLLNLVSGGNFGDFPPSLDDDSDGFVSSDTLSTNDILSQTLDGATVVTEEQLDLESRNSDDATSSDEFILSLILVNAAATSFINKLNKL